MNTPTHLLVAAAVFAKPEQPRVTWAALAGGLLPDFSLYFLFFWHRFVLNVSEREIFGRLYYSDDWQRIFAVDNSFFVWGAAMAVALWLRSGWLIAFAGAGLLHLSLDFPLHNEDARAHFWPLTMWKFESPISYWDRAHHGDIVGPLEALFATGLCIVLWRRFRRVWPRFVVGVAAVATILPWLVFAVVMQLGSA